MLDGNISVVMPILDEAKALPRFLSDLSSTIASHPELAINELVFVDDGSRDGTLEFVERFARQATRCSTKVLVREGRRGPASAEVDGFKAASNAHVVKMDADGQHPPSALPSLVGAIGDNVDVVVASRYVEGGGATWPPLRGIISLTARHLTWLLVPPTRCVRDPVSGFFFARRNLVSGLDSEVPHYKLLAYLLASNPRTRVREIPFVMGNREEGQSKIVGTSFDYVANFFDEILRYRQIYSGKGTGSGESHGSREIAVPSHDTLGAR